MSKIKLINENGVIKGIDPQTGEEIPVEFDSLNIDRSLIDGTPVPGYETEATNITQTSDYDSESFLEVQGNEVFLIYHSGSEHAANDSVVNQRVATYDDLRKNGAQAFVNATEETIASDSSYGIRQHSVGKAPDGTLVMWYRRWQDGGTHIDLRYKTLAPDADSWSSATVASSGLSAPAPFGGSVQTSNGLMQLMYDSSSGDVVAKFAQNESGTSWGNETTVVSGSNYQEPTPCAVTEDHLVVLTRSNTTESPIPYVTSSDGGATWDSDSTMTIRGNTGTPVWASKTGQNEVTVLLGDRDQYALYGWKVSAREFWQDPSILEDAPRMELAKAIEGSRTANYGYPTTCTVGPGEKHVLMTWYDGDGDPGTDQVTDVWVGSMPSFGGSPYYLDPSDLTDVDGRQLNELPYLFKEDWGDNPNWVFDDVQNTYIIERSGQAVGTVTDAHDAQQLTGYRRPPWQASEVGGSTFTQGSLEWDASGGNMVAFLDEGALTVGRWAVDFEWTTLGTDDDDLRVGPMRSGNSNYWSVILFDTGNVILRKEDGGNMTSVQTSSWGESGTGDTERHLLEVYRYPGGTWDVQIDGQSLSGFPVVDSFVPSNVDATRLRMTDSGGGSAITVRSFLASPL